MLLPYEINSSPQDSSVTLQIAFLINKLALVERSLPQIQQHPAVDLPLFSAQGINVKKIQKRKSGGRTMSFACFNDLVDVAESFLHPSCRQRKRRAWQRHLKRSPTSPHPVLEA